ncbi:hypothetical protein AML24_17055, partial [Escherichia coli]
MPDAALTPYLAYKVLQIQYITGTALILLWPARFFLLRFPGLQACHTQRRQALFFSSLPRFLRRYPLIP